MFSSTFLCTQGKPSKEWKFWTFQQYWDDSMKFAKALAKMDVGIFKIVNVLGFNAVRLRVEKHPLIHSLFAPSHLANSTLTH
jgi:hypothetical protein